jgi:ATP-binding cassette subfamily B protein
MSEAETSAAAPGAGRALGALLSFARPYSAAIGIACLGVFGTSSLLLLASMGIRNMADAGLGEDMLAALNHSAGLMVAGAAGFSVIAYIRDYTIAWVAEKVTADIRQSLYNHILELELGFFEAAPTGDILSRLLTDVELVHGFIGSALVRWLRSLLVFAGGLGLLLATSAGFAAIIAALGVIVALPLLAIASREQRLSATAQERVADLYSYTEESISAIRTIQAFTHEAIDRGVFRSRLDAGVRAALKCAAQRALLVAVGFTLGVAALTLCIWISVSEVATHRHTAGELLSVLFYVSIVATAGATLLEVWGDFQRAVGAIGRILELLAQRPQIVAPMTPVMLAEPVRGALAFDQVSFRYPARPDRAVLEHFSVSIAAGETVAIVGPSGAGKSTILHLLARFYDPSEGTVRLDDHDIRHVDLAKLRTAIGLVPQDPMIFGANVWENIRYGRPGATDREVLAAAETATAMEFIGALPQGLDTFLGEKGVRLSGGQRQRLALARVILKDPAVLLLDEATSALDAESEYFVQQALTKLAVGRTTLIVAHRLATVHRADRILVMQEGRLVASNTHQALLGENSLYRRLAELQFMDDAA